MKKKKQLDKKYCLKEKFLELNLDFGFDREKGMPTWEK